MTTKWEEEARRLERKWEGLKLCSAFSSSDSDVEARLAKIEVGWKALIKDWLADVKDRVGGKEGVGKDVKNLRVHWYKLYAECRAKLKEVKGAKKAMARAKEDTVEILEGGDRVGRSKVVKLKSTWKKFIKAWEQQWIMEHKGSKPEGQDKAEVEEWYAYYKKLGEVGVEMDKKILEAGSGLLLE